MSLIDLLGEAIEKDPVRRSRSVPIIERAFVLPEDLATALHELCRKTDQDPRDVVIDAVKLFIDGAHADLERIGEGGDAGL